MAFSAVSLISTVFSDPLVPHITTTTIIIIIIIIISDVEEDLYTIS